MCGIHAVISTTAPAPIEADFEQRLRNRGPDHVASKTIELQRDDSTRLSVTLTSTVLSLRGDEITPQPLVDNSSGSVLCWNGEAWKIDGEPVIGNDGKAVLRHLTQASSSIPEALKSIEGPFAFVFLDNKTSTLYYGRDRLGRRSLLSHATDSLVLSSVAGTIDPAWIEVEADGFYSINLAESGELSTLTRTRHTWTDDDLAMSGIGVFNNDIPNGDSSQDRETPAVPKLRSMLSDSLRPRVLGVPLPPNATATDSRIAVLFSGGLDCTVLARMIGDLVPPEQSIDLLNVAFENPRIASLNKDVDVEGLYEMCPDRITGRKSFEELLKACPDRTWRFVNINVPFSDTTKHRDDVVKLIYPHNTEMDLSIAYALYFAARGKGLAQTTSTIMPTEYSTTARVLLSGLGADELFGGYQRHETAFKRHGYAGLLEELKLDVGRLGKRNLGRDDRAMSHWGREVRFPYLDEEFARWAIGMAVETKCDFGNAASESGIEPGKRVLRLLARELELPNVATEKKRAIQFGARTAKMESGKVKGTTLIS